MRKTILLFLLFMMITAATCASENPEKKAQNERLLAHYVSKSFPKNSFNDVLTIITRLHALYKVHGLVFIKSKTGANRFSFPSRIIYMNVDDTARAYEMWIAELSHAVQFCAAPLKYSLLFLRDGIRTFSELLFLKKKERQRIRELVKNGCPRFTARFWVAWGRRYQENGTPENEAHSRIEQVIDQLIKKDLREASNRTASFLLYGNKEGAPNQGPFYQPPSSST